MLPINLLRVRTRKGQINPIYAEVNNENLNFAKELTSLFKGNLGKPKGGLKEKVSALEPGGYEYRFVRGLAQILQRQCTFKIEAPISPILARKLVFKEASHRNPTTKTTREQVLNDVADQLEVTTTQLEKSLYADLDEELILEGFDQINEVELLKRYNLSLTQTLLFRAIFLEIKASEYWKEILRKVKFLGLMYSAESRNGEFKITVTGPLSTFKLTQRYGTAIAKLLPTIVQSKDWEISSSIIRTGQFGRRIYQLRLTSDQLGDKIKPAHLNREDEQNSFDSFVEAKFFEDFRSLNTDWKITREPTPLLVGKHVFLPDFCFEKRGVIIYLEIVGFWTRKYLETKIKKLQQLKGVNILIAANQKLACDRLKQAQGEIIFFKRLVPAGKIFRMLKNYEKNLLEAEIQRLDLNNLHLAGDIVELDTIAQTYGVSVEALQVKLKDVNVDGYTLAGAFFIKNKKLQGIKSKLTSLTEPSVSKAIEVIEAEDVMKPYDVLSALNYGIRWNGLDLENSLIYEKEKTDQ
ncbi:MAG: DUF790 family protein [Candidatus Bathyarchaeota archaeon]|nr:MAG: DUF790 family protein [Candidatus Bathyarchaeota archaeon]